MKKFGFDIHGVLDTFPALLDICGALVSAGHEVHVLTGPVDARNTSKGCARCWHVDDANLPKGTLLFKCTSCGHMVHSDKNGADNILVRTLPKRQDLFGTGRLSTVPAGHPAVLGGNTLCEVPGDDGHLAGVMGQAALSLAAR